MTKTHLSGKENTASLTLCRVFSKGLMIDSEAKGGQTWTL